jgi:formyltetrahydrofolate-dependent phosphoribosylglycinamide formyltransferase
LDLWQGAEVLPEKIIIYTDGGSRGNPGPAAAAFVLTDSGQNRLCARAFYLGETTNNFAEYTAVVKALEAAKDYQARDIKLYSDSELLVKQLTGRYKVKSQQLRPLFTQAVELLEKYDSKQIEFIPRDKNKEADGLVNQALNLEKDTEHMEQTGSEKGKTVRLGVLISGGGRTLINILEYVKKGRLNATVAIVISSRSTVAGVERAKAAGLDVRIIRTKDYPDVDEFSRQIEQALAAADVELVVQAGWLCMWKIPKRYEYRVMNIHPALLPSFGGKGMWGHHVHEAVLKRGCKLSGCTVHFCTNEYDEGPIIVQRTCPVKNDDTPDTLAARVFEQECIAYPEAIRLFAQNRMKIENGIVIIN